MNKESLIKSAKEFRVAADSLLQEMKKHKDTIRLTPSTHLEDSNEAIANHILSIRDLESCIMRQGMVLKCVGNPTPYPQSYNPDSTAVEPTADGLKL